MAAAASPHEALLLSSEERGTLEHWQRSTTIAAGLARRGKMILLLAAGHSQSDVAGSVGVHRTVVRKWAKRFLAQRLDGLSRPSAVPRGIFPRRSRSTWYAWPANARIRWAAACPVGLHRTGAAAHRRGDR